MAYNYTGDASLDYFPCRYGKSRLTFRGPKADTSGPYAVVLGGTETYGKFLPQPYPTRLAQETGLSVANLGFVNAGLDLYLKDPEMMALIQGANVTVLQVMGSHNMTNRFYSVHPRRNDRFVAASPLLQTIFREVDFTDFHFTRHLLGHLRGISPDKFEVLAEELRAAWVARMLSLISAVRGKVVLLWLAETPPPPPERRSELGRDPLLVDAEMINAILPKVADYLEIGPNPKLKARGTEGMVFAPLDEPAARALPNGLIHAEVAAKLAPMVTRFF